jgi:uncharacterized protein (DUF1501 family)
MNCQSHLIAQRGVSLSRRWFLSQCGVGLGRIGLATLLADALAGRGHSAPTASDPFAPQRPHFAGKAKAVIHLFMAGAPSQLDLFDYKPQLVKHDGKSLPPAIIGDQRYAFIRSDAAVMAPRFKFAKHGACGMELCEMLPHLAGIADDICLVKSVTTDQFNHAPAQIFFNTGFAQPGRPSMGSWVTYGLGAETRDLPAFVVMSTGSGISGGTANWSSGILPTVYAGVRLRNQGDPVLNVANPPGIDKTLQRQTLDLVRELNQQRLGELGDPEIATRINSYEMAFRLQTSAPELTDLRSESRATLDLYGCDPDKPSFARACLLARRMVERGVRFINIYHEGWDAHSDVVGNHTGNCKATDQASAALVKDLKQRGLLASTLVVWGGEFGRTPMVETNPTLGRALGRDHHPQAYTMWLAGGGIRGGLTHGVTDDFGFHVASDRVHVHDLQATILHCLGLDHRRLTFQFRGLDFRLTGVEEHHPVRALLA